MKIECVLFDLDGVLVDACDWHYEALNMALKEVMGFEISRKDHLSTYNGLPTAVKLKLLRLNEKDSKQVETIKQLKTFQIIKEKATILPEKQELHAYLKKNKIKIACVTNSIYETAVEMLKQTGQIEFFDLIVSNKDVSRNKPYPDCYNLAIEKLKANPDFSLCVEDSPKGIQAAKASFVKNLWIVSNSTDVTLKNYKEITK